MKIVKRRKIDEIGDEKVLYETKSKNAQSFSDFKGKFEEMKDFIEFWRFSNEQVL